MSNSDNPPPNPAPHTMLSMAFHNPAHGYSGTFQVQVLTSGKRILSRTEYRAAMVRSCPNRRRPGRGRCTCSMELNPGSRLVKGAVGEWEVVPGFRWVLVSESPGRSVTGSAFTVREAIGAAKSAGEAARGCGHEPRTITVTLLVFDAKQPGAMPTIHPKYSATYVRHPEPYGGGSWRDSIVARATQPPNLNPGHGEDSEPLEPTTPFRFDDSESPELPRIDSEDPNPWPPLRGA